MFVRDWLGRIRGKGIKCMWVFVFGCVSIDTSTGGRVGFGSVYNYTKPFSEWIGGLHTPLSPLFLNGMENHMQ